MVDEEPSPKSRPAKKRERTEAEQIEDDFFHECEQLQPGSVFTNYPKERRGAKTLVQRALKIAPDDTRQFLKRYVARFQQLKADGHELFHDQPIIPSVLASGGLMPRVLEKMNGFAREGPSRGEMAVAALRAKRESGKLEGSS